MLHLVSAHDGRQVELLQVLGQELVHCGDISVLHWPQAGSLGSLQKAGQIICVACMVAFITQGLSDKRHGDALCLDQPIFSPTTQHSPPQPCLPSRRTDAIGRDTDGKDRREAQRVPEPHVPGQVPLEVASYPLMTQDLCFPPGLCSCSQQGQAGRRAPSTAGNRLMLFPVGLNF